MKRQSIAEQTLSRQVHRITDEITSRNQKLALLQAEINSLISFRAQLQTEIADLRYNRTRAIDASKP